MWYLQRPQYHSELVRMLVISMRKTIGLSKNTPGQRDLSFQICHRKALDAHSAIFKLTGKKMVRTVEEIFAKEFSEARERAQRCPVKMGGQANLNILYHLAESISATKVIETGVAYGWSSLAFLLSLQKRKNALLISTDKPYPGANNEQYVGCVVPEGLMKNWRIIRSPDRKAIPKALQEFSLQEPGTIDLCHYDSDKTYEGRQTSYSKLWGALRQGGIFISDDIGDNMAFFSFCKAIHKEPVIVQGEKNFMGIIVKD